MRGKGFGFVESLDHPVRPRQHFLRNRQPDLLGGFQINNQLELVRLLQQIVS